MAVKKAIAVAIKTANHIFEAEPGAACDSYVVQRKAPGAIRAMALMVTPVKPRVGCIVTSAVGPVDAMS
jgi:hypothetical protein